MSKLFDLLNTLIGKVNNAVKVESQTLTDEQKAQARANIGAAAEGEGGSSGGSAEGAVLYTEQTLTEAQQTQARTNIGAVKSWNELADRPVVVEGGDTLTWDGNTEGRKTIEDIWYLVSSAMPSIDEIVDATVDLGDGGSLLPTTATETMEGLISIDVGWDFPIFVIAADNLDLGGLIVESKGVYFPFIGQGYSLTIPGYTGFGQEKIAPSHLYQPDWNQTDETAADFIKNKPFGEIEVREVLTWDGNTEGLVSVGGFFYKVSSAVVTLDDLVNGVELVFNDGEAITIPQEDLSELISGLVVGDGVVFVTEEAVGVECDGFVFPESGVYLMNEGGEAYVESVTVPGYTGFPVSVTVKRLDEKYLPTGIIVLKATGEGYLYENVIADGMRLTAKRFIQLFNLGRPIYIMFGYYRSPVLAINWGEHEYVSVIFLKDGTTVTTGYTAEYTGS